ncbi:MAG: glycine betaine ABC transporter substrate-binding protein, partial [Comamonas sp.]
QIVANKAWAEKNPAAAKLFAVMQLPVGDINAQNFMMSQGQNKAADIERHTTGWIKAHQKQFDGWLQQARDAAR